MSDNLPAQDHLMALSPEALQGRLAALDYALLHVADYTPKEWRLIARAIDASRKPFIAAAIVFPTKGWFRRRTATIRAEQLTERIRINTREGTLTGEPGDWLITGIEGEQYPCADSIFRRLYTPLLRDEITDHPPDHEREEK